MLVNAPHIFLHKTALPAQTISLAIMSTGSPKSEEKTRYLVEESHSTVYN
jgi:hypothetical protein